MTAPAIVIARAARLTHSNGVQRARYLAIHAVLSRPPARDPDDQTREDQA